MRETEKCPLCECPVESRSHVFKCQSEAQKANWDKGMCSLKTFLRKRDTMPAIAKIIVQRLTEWRNDQAPQQLRVPRAVRDALAEQDSIGWKWAFLGFWSKKWSALQLQYYQSKGKLNTGKRWLAAIIKKLHDVAWDLWVYRNGEVHRHREGQVAKLQEERIRTEYQRGFRGLLPSARPFIRRSEESVLKDTRDGKEAWLIRIELERDKALTPEYVQMERQRQLMERYFQA